MSSRKSYGLVPRRIREWCSDHRCDLYEVRLGDVYPELRVTRSAEIDWRELPKRAFTYLAPRFSRWSDFAECSIGELSDVVSIGQLTVERLLEEIDRRSEEGEIVGETSAPFLEQPQDSHRDAGTVGASTAFVETWHPNRYFFDAFETLQRWATWRDPGGGIRLRKLINSGGDALPSDVAEALDQVLDAPLKLPDQEPHTVDPYKLLQNRMEPRLFEILCRRRWTDVPETLEVISSSYGITRERVRQLQNIAFANVDEIISATDELRWSIQYVRTSLGEASLTSVVADVMAGLHIRFPSISAWILLDRAGGYSVGPAGLFLSAGFDADLLLHDLEQLADSVEGLDSEEAIQMLDAHGVLWHSAEEFLASVACMKKFGDTWFQWRGDVAYKAAVVLRIRDEPATLEQIVNDIGEGHSTASLRNVIGTDRRFLRVSRSHWGLAVWGGIAYSGIGGSMIEYIAAHGGSVALNNLIDHMVHTYGTPANSVRTYASTLQFVVEDGVVRIRRASDDWPYRTDLSTARGSFRVGAEIRYLVRVTRDGLRGSGQMIPEAMAHALGVRPNGERVFEDESGAVVKVVWRPISLTGPSIGSIRAFVNGVGGTFSDHVILSFDPAAGTVSTKIVRTGSDPHSCLSELVESSPSATSIALSIGVEEEELYECLCGRGDDVVVDWLRSL